MNNHIMFLLMAIVIVICVVGIGISIYNVKDSNPNTTADDIDVLLYCPDGVVCYGHYFFNGYGMDCFRDQDLVEKYCVGLQ